MSITSSPSKLSFPCIHLHLNNLIHYFISMSILSITLSPSSIGLPLSSSTKDLVAHVFIPSAQSSRDRSRLSTPWLTGLYPWSLCKSLHIHPDPSPAMTWMTATISCPLNVTRTVTQSSPRTRTTWSTSSCTTRTPRLNSRKPPLDISLLDLLTRSWWMERGRKWDLMNSWSSWARTDSKWSIYRHPLCCLFFFLF